MSAYILPICTTYFYAHMKSNYQSELSVSCVCLCLYLPQLESAGRLLKVTEARLEDSGRYTCLATNAAGEAQQHIRLSVHGNLKKHILSTFCVKGQGGDRRISSDKLLFLCVILVCPSEPPSIPDSGEIINQTILSGFPTELECKATGSPLPGKTAHKLPPPSCCAQ